MVLIITILHIVFSKLRKLSSIPSLESCLILLNIMLYMWQIQTDTKFKTLLHSSFSFCITLDFSNMISLSIRGIQGIFIPLFKPFLSSKCLPYPIASDFFFLSLRSTSCLICFNDISQNSEQNSVPLFALCNIL